MGILSIRRVIRSVKIDLSEWAYNSFALCAGMVNAKILDGKVVYGIYSGPKHETCVRDNIVTHWIETSFGEKIDPTMFTFINPSRPEILFLIDLDERFNYLQEVPNKPCVSKICPPMTKNGKRIRLFVEHDPVAYDLLRLYTKYNKSCTVNVLAWIGHTDPTIWADSLVTIYDGITRSGYDFLISPDNMNIYKKKGGINNKQIKDMIYAT